MTLLCLFRTPKAFVAQGIAPSWWSKGTGDTAPSLKDEGQLHTQHITATSCPSALKPHWAGSEG